jgi:hypothetical protein
LFHPILQYKIELKVRNHNTLARQTLIDTIVSCVPSGWTVDLENAEVFILVEVFKVRPLLTTHQSASSADESFRAEHLRHWHC